MTDHKGELHYSGPEYGDVWECDVDCPSPDHLEFYEADGLSILYPGAQGYIVVMKNENRRQRLLRWILRRPRPCEVYPVTVKE